MATQTVDPQQQEDQKKHPLGWLLDQLAEQLPGAVKEEEGTMPSQTLAKMWAFAEKIKDAKFINATIRGDKASVFYLIAKGHEMGAKWTHAVQSLYMTPDGKAGIQGDLALAVLLSKGFRIFWPVQDEKRGVCQIGRPQCSCPYDPAAKKITCICGNSQEMEVTLEQMEKMGFSKTKDGHVKFAWKDSKNMLRWRSFAYAYRIYAADVLGGIYLMEEIQDMALADTDLAAETRMETVEMAAGTSPNAPKKADEGIISTELGNQFREAAYNAGKRQAWVDGQLAIVEGEIKAALAKDPSTDVKLMATLKVGILVTKLQDEAKPKTKRTRKQQADDREAEAQGKAAEAMEARTGLDKEDAEPAPPAAEPAKKPSLF
jgi:hypothetical protein